MSTDIYGARVLAVDPEELRVRFRVFMVYYDTHSRSYSQVPDDPTFFFGLLWEGAEPHADHDRRGPLARLVDVDTALDSEWVDANTRRFVSRVERVDSLNFPPTDEQWERLHDFYYERGGGWQDEDLLIQFTYDVWVTERQWLEPLSVGQSWGTTWFPLHSDTWTDEDAPHLPDLTEPVVTLRPYASTRGDLAYEHVNQARFSDDGKYLAAVSDKGRVWVYDTADWSQVVHTSFDAGDMSIYVPLLMWSVGGHVLTVKSYGDFDEEPRPQWAYDVAARRPVDAPYEPGLDRSRDGTYRISPNRAGEGGYDLHPTDRSPYRRISHAGTWDPIQCTTFAGDGSRLFLGAQDNLYVIDPATGEVESKALGVARFFSVAGSPDGTYLAAASFSRKLAYGLTGGERPHELCVWRVADNEIILGRQLRTYVEDLDWSPDGRMLAAVLEPIGDAFGSGSSEIAIYRAGPGDPHGSVRPVTVRW